MRYELSPEANKYVNEIYDYSATAFGIDKAVDYLIRINEVCSTLQDNPNLGRERPEIRTELRSISVESHVIFYRRIGGRVRIIRVLHASRDLPSMLQQE